MCTWGKCQLSFSCAIKFILIYIGINSITSHLHGTSFNLNQHMLCSSLTRSHCLFIYPFIRACRTLPSSPWSPRPRHCCLHRHYRCRHISCRHCSHRPCHHPCHCRCRSHHRLVVVSWVPIYPAFHHEPIQISPRRILKKVPQGSKQRCNQFGYY